LFVVADCIVDALPQTCGGATHDEGAEALDAVVWVAIGAAAVGCCCCCLPP